MILFSICLFIFGFIMFGISINVLTNKETDPGIILLLFSVAIFSFGLLTYTMGVRQSAASDELMILTKSNAVELKVDKKGNTSFALKDSTFLDLYNYLQSDNNR